MGIGTLLRSDPDFFIVGTQKGGTTSLYNYLAQHPAVLTPSNKEINFFAGHYGKGFGWYKRRFPMRYQRYRRARALGQRVISGEATPFYLFHPHVPRRIHAAYPDARIIAMLRNPVDRAFSHHAYHVKLGVETLAFEAAIEAEPERLRGELAKMLSDETYPGNNYKMFSYVERGMYAAQLERWFASFDRSQILIIRSEDFFTDPEGCFIDVQKFLGLKDHTLSTYRTFNAGRESAALNANTRARLVEYFRPHNQRLYDLIRTDFGWQ